MTTENDIVLIYFEESPMVFARIENILADSKKDWYHVTFLFLQLPLQTVTWILRDIYINGEEFTMNGKKMRLEQVVCPDHTTAPEPEKNDNIQENSDGAKVISLVDRKK